MKRKNYPFIVLLSALVCLSVSPVHAQNVIGAIDAINQLKTELYLQTLTQDPLSVIANFELQYEQSYNSWSDEDKLIFDNVLASEKLIFLQDEDAKQGYILLNEQNLLCEEFFEGKKSGDLDPWFLTSWADIKSRLLSFLSGMDVFRESAKAKDLYTAALKNDKDFSAALRGYALWLFYAPPIAGGGHAKALKQMSLAVDYAQNDTERFFALSYRSQVLFGMGEEEKSLEDLKKVHTLFPEESMTSMMREANENGKNFF